VSDDMVELTVNGRAIRATRGASVASALLDNAVTEFRTSTSGEPRTPVCGMGVCFECRVTIDGVAHLRACMIGVRPGMIVTTGTLDDLRIPRVARDDSTVSGA
jgi:D-hydroxyproline dehydrogenase subunit gamma